MDYPTNGGAGSSGSAKDASRDMQDTEAAEQMREYAQSATASFNDAIRQGRELVLRYPVLSVAGAVAAGWMFARFVARRR